MIRMEDVWYLSTNQSDQSTNDSSHLRHSVACPGHRRCVGVDQPSSIGVSRMRDEAMSRFRLLVPPPGTAELW